MPELFTTHTGEVFEMSAEELTKVSAQSQTSSVDQSSITTINMAPINLSDPHGLDGSVHLDAPSASDPSISAPRHVSRCGSSNPLLEIVDPENLPKKPASPPRPPTQHLLTNKRGTRHNSNTITVSMLYNEYGELVYEKDLQHHPTPDELTVTQLLRVIKKAYHHEACAPLF